MFTIQLLIRLQITVNIVTKIRLLVNSNGQTGKSVSRDQHHLKSVVKRLKLLKRNGFKLWQLISCYWHLAGNNVNGIEYFAIETTTGEIIPLQVLDRERFNRFDLLIKVNKTRLLSFIRSLINWSPDLVLLMYTIVSHRGLSTKQSNQPRSNRRIGHHCWWRQRQCANHVAVSLWGCDSRTPSGRFIYSSGFSLRQRWGELFNPEASYCCFRKSHNN